ncbi:MAG: DnaJ domain-containing protein [Streptosporangiaceae bacterium]
MTERAEIRALDGNDPYELLGVARDASAAQIGQAFKDQIKIWHPDRCPTDEARAAAAERTRLLSSARTVLLNHRDLYDAPTVHRPVPPAPAPPAPPAAQPTTGRRPGLLRRGLAIGCLGYLVIAALYFLLRPGAPEDGGATLTPRAAVPHAFAGVWTGEVRQADGPPLTVRLSLPEGFKIGVDQSVACGGNLVPMAFEAGTLTLAKSVTARGCAAATVILTLLPDGRLSLRYAGGAGSDPPAATLDRG